MHHQDRAQHDGHDRQAGKARDQRSRRRFQESADEDAETAGDLVSLRFPGKSGKRQALEIDDAELAEERDAVTKLGLIKG